MSHSVVFCGSLGSSSAMWNGQLRALGGRPLLMIDHPGHGGEPLAEVRDVRDLAERVLERAGPEPFDFVGLSLGGAVGLRIAIDAPGRVRRLVLACSSARFGEPQGWRQRAEIVRAEGLAAIVDAVLGRWFTPSHDRLQGFREMFLSTDAEGYARCCEALACFDMRDEVEQIDVPTLVVAGDQDPSTPVEHGRFLASKIPGARLAVLRGAAHLANVERPDEFNRLLKEHL